MGWDNPPLPWQELRRRMTWGPADCEPAGAARPPEPAEGEPVKPARDVPAAGPREPRPSRRRAPSRGPNSTATPRSASWTGRPPPASWSPRPPGSGSRSSPSPTTTGCTGCRSSRRPRARLADQGGPKPGHGVRRRAEHWPARQPDRRRPTRRGGHLLSPGPRRRRLPAAVAVISAAQLAGGQKGRPVYDIGKLAGTRLSSA